MVLTAPAMVAPALKAAVEAVATAGPAATPHVAGEHLHITLHGIPTPVPALRCT